MKKRYFCLPAFLAASLVLHARADTFAFNITGAGVSGAVTLTYGTATDATYPQGFEVTGISGSFSDATLGLVDTPFLGLVPINPAIPDPTNHKAPADFSRFAVATGLDPQSHGSITYDNLFYPGGSPQTASDYPFSGGVFDIYGLLFNIGNGEVVDFWSNGSFMGSPLDYGVAVATADDALDYVGGGVQVTPEPSSFLLLGSGLLTIALWLRPGFRPPARRLS